jgi:hypothetical protein
MSRIVCPGADWGQKTKCNRFYKGHRDTAEMADIASHPLKKPIPLKIYLKSLAILEKASIITLKKSSKIVEIIIKVLHF